MLNTAQHRYFIVHKPPNMVSQFVSSHTVNLLHQLPFNFPSGTHAIGRLDANSEGLLLLTTNKAITQLLFNPNKQHTRTYLIQVNKVVQPEAVTKLKNGITIVHKGKNNSTYTTKPCDVQVVDNLYLAYGITNHLHPNAPYTWLLITLTEGKYHQVRKMVAAIGHKCIRLIRVAIEGITLHNTPQSAVVELTEIDFFTKLNIP